MRGDAVRGSGGSNHTVLISNRGVVVTFGDNSEGQLGVGHADHVEGVQTLELDNITQVACGENYTLCLSSEGEVMYFGSFIGSVYGPRPLQDSTTPIKIDGLPNISYIAAGRYPLCVDVYGMVWLPSSSGHIRFSKLGDIETVHIGACQILAKDKHGDAWGINAFIDCIDFPKVFRRHQDISDLEFERIDIRNVYSISSGFRFGALLTQEGELFTFGRQNHGELGRIGDNLPGKVGHTVPIVQMMCGYSHMAFVDENGDCFTFGCNLDKQLGKYEQGTVAKKFNLGKLIPIAMGGCHTLFQDSDGKIYACGINNHNQLGIDSTENQSELTPIHEFLNNILTGVTAKSANK